MRDKELGIMDDRGGTSDMRQERREKDKKHGRRDKGRGRGTRGKEKMLKKTEK
jgi:hypothetical protein